MSKIQCSKLWNTVTVSPNKGYAACFSFVPFFPPSWDEAVWFARFTTMEV